jgi:CheY-like chemotaxis protein
MMPGMDGYRFRAEQKLDPRLCDIPILLMTAGGDVHGKADELGAAGYLKKPFKDIDLILTEVAKFCA